MCQVALCNLYSLRWCLGRGESTSAYRRECTRGRQHHIDNVSFLPCCCVFNFYPLFGDTLRDQHISDRPQLLSLDHDFLSSRFSRKGIYRCRGRAGSPEFLGKIICFNLEALEPGDTGSRTTPLACLDDNGNVFQLTLPEEIVSECCGKRKARLDSLYDRFPPFSDDLKPGLHVPDDPINDLVAAQESRLLELFPLASLQVRKCVQECGIRRHVNVGLILRFH